jgi:hypothetical protein
MMGFCAGVGVGLGGCGGCQMMMRRRHCRRRRGEFHQHHRNHTGFWRREVVEVVVMIGLAIWLGGVACDVGAVWVGLVVDDLVDAVGDTAVDLPRLLLRLVVLGSSSPSPSRLPQVEG